MDQNQTQNLLSQINLSEEEKQKLADLKAQEEILERIMTRVSYALTKEDMVVLEEMAQKSISEQTVRYFLLAKVPNLDLIAKEEIEAYQPAS
jgi:hypothetical protein